MKCRRGVCAIYVLGLLSRCSSRLFSRDIVTRIKLQNLRCLSCWPQAVNEHIHKKMYRRQAFRNGKGVIV
jgi:hypothetical protein